MAEEPVNQRLEELVRIVQFEAPKKDAKTEPFDPRDLDYFPPGEPAESLPWRARTQKFELLP